MAKHYEAAVLYMSGWLESRLANYSKGNMKRSGMSWRTAIEVDSDESEGSEQDEDAEEQSDTEEEEEEELPTKVSITYSYYINIKLYYSATPSHHFAAPLPRKLAMRVWPRCGKPVTARRRCGRWHVRL